MLDVAARVGSGVGSYGVPRYYVLLAGKDESAAFSGDSSADVAGGIILDVKYEPHASAVASILNAEVSAGRAQRLRAA